jgi:hypothetical protein
VTAIEELKEGPDGQKELGGSVGVEFLSLQVDRLLSALPVIKFRRQD